MISVQISVTIKNHWNIHCRPLSSVRDHVLNITIHKLLAQAFLLILLVSRRHQDEDDTQLAPVYSAENSDQSCCQSGTIDDYVNDQQ